MAVSFIVRAAVALCVAVLVPGQAEAGAVRTVDPNAALLSVPADPPPPPLVDPAASRQSGAGEQQDVNADLVSSAGDAQPAPPAPAIAATRPGSYQKDDVLAAAEGVFGKGAQGLAEIVEKILKDQGEPNAYISGREASGAVGVGLRYGSGTLSHTVEGQRPVYWTGPSLGFDLGADATKTFVLVYNLYDSQDLYRRYPQVEGRAYFVGGFSATYLRRGDVALIPIRLGVGVRLGANIGYMKFSEKSRWLPF